MPLSQLADTFGELAWAEINAVLEAADIDAAKRMAEHHGYSVASERSLSAGTVLVFNVVDEGSLVNRQASKPSERIELGAIRDIVIEEAIHRAGEDLDRLLADDGGSEDGVMTQAEVDAVTAMLGAPREVGPFDFDGPCVPGDAEWLRRRDLFLADASPTQWWWLSFVDATRPPGEQFVGLCIVSAPNIVAATTVAREFGCNPGGEVAGFLAVPPGWHPKPEYIGKLFAGSDGRAFAEKKLEEFAERDA